MVALLARCNLNLLGYSRGHPVASPVHFIPPACSSQVNKFHHPPSSSRKVVEGLKLHTLPMASPIGSESVFFGIVNTFHLRSSPSSVPAPDGVHPIVIWSELSWCAKWSTFWRGRTANECTLYSDVDRSEDGRWSLLCAPEQINNMSRHLGGVATVLWMSFCSELAVIWARVAKIIASCRNPFKKRYLILLKIFFCYGWPIFLYFLQLS